MTPQENGDTAEYASSRERVSAEIRYHNEATYKAFDLYTKVLFAAWAGISLVTLNRDKISPATADVLYNAAGLLIILTSCLFAVILAVHQKSKIERWKKAFYWYSPLFWNETWWIVGAFAVTYYTYFILLPDLRID